MKNQMDILEFKGYSGSGKTESIIALIKYLKSRSYNVISLKSIHIKDFSVDTPGKNTWRMSEAGAEPVISVAPNETAFIVKQRLDLEAVIKISTVIAQEKKRLEIMRQDQTNANANANANTTNTTNTNGNTSKNADNCLFIKDTSKIDCVIAEGFWTGSNPLVICIRKLEDLYDLMQSLFKNNNWQMILKKLFCISGSILQDLGYEEIMQEGLEMKIKETLIDAFKRAFKEYQSSGSMEITDLREYTKRLKDIRVINIKKEPALFLEILEGFVYLNENG